jgi:signal transduction histidine kinase
MPRRSFRSNLFDLCVAASVALLAAWWWHQYRLGGLAYGCLVGSVLMWRRRRPVAVFVAVSLVTAGMVPIEIHGTRLHEGMLLVALAAAMYAVVKYASTLRAGVLAGIGAVTGGTAVLVLRTVLEFPLSPPDAGAVGRALLVTLSYGAGVWSVGLIARTHGLHTLFAKERAATAERERDHLARIAVAEERARIARELHDIVAHSLSVMIVHANGAEYALDRNPERVRAALRTISATGQDALGEIKQLVQILRSDGGDSTADQTPVALDQVGAVVERARGAGLAVDLVVNGTPPQVPGGIALAVYRIVQEALTNTLKHAGPAPTATVRVGYGADAIEVDVTDNGAGSAGATPGGHGLVGMRERVSLYGGTFDAGPYLGGGWRVRARIPFADADRTVPA